MKKLFNKEIKLAASPLTFFFLLSALLTFAPGYPILLGAFFTTLGIFYSFQKIGLNNDIEYSMLLPVSKSDVVKAKYLFVIFIELCSFVLMAVITLIRMTLLKNAAIYTSNVLMNANFTFLGFALLVFGLFNVVFVRGFFKTAYNVGKPFIIYCIASFLAVALAESIHYFPGLDALNEPGFENIVPQLTGFAVGAVMSIVLTVSGVRHSIILFQRTDL